MTSIYEKTNKMCYITVVVATYKRPFLLKKCIESILDNVYQYYEIVVVGQGLDFSSKEVIEGEFSHESKLRYIHIEKVGLSYARNAGCQHAKGEVIVFIDDDAIATR